MGGLIIDSEACIGCGRCVRACASGGIVVEGDRPNRCARVTDGCILCGGCVDACPVNAISIERDEAAVAADLDAYRDIWVFVQTDEHDTVTPVAYELMGKGRELADARGCRLVALVGMGTEGSLGDLEHLVCAGADEVLVCRDERLRQNDAEVYARLICDLVAERKPGAILYGATAFGRELAPGVAVRLQTGLTADCTVLSMDTETGLLQQTRPAFGGNLMATIVCPSHRPQMATVRPGIFPAPEPREVRSAVVEDVPLAEGVECRVRVLSREVAGTDGSITDADVLVVVGRGVGSKKALAPVRRLVELLGERLGCKVEIGCTRPVVEAGWLDYSHQVGQTGVSVAPKLLLSLGVSGAIQHLAGISGAQTIVAVNDDPDAPIFAAAQYKVVADCHAVIDELIEKLEA